jgi:diguanylate cyclase (GGDEF)-like protein
MSQSPAPTATTSGSPAGRALGWLVPEVPPAIRVELERRQLARVQQHVPMIYGIASLNALIIMAVCAHAGIAPVYYAWMSVLVVLATLRAVAWVRTKRVVLTPAQVSARLKGSAWFAFSSLLVMGTFTSWTFVSGAFARSTLIPISLAFGSMSVAHCFSTVRPSAVAALALGIMPSSVAMLLVGDFDARVLGVSMLTVAVLMMHFVADQFDHLVTELQLQQEVFGLANTDALTGLLNRRALVASLERELAAGPGNTFAVALLDLDGFKGINDRLGHLAGDAFLRVVGRRLAAGSGASSAVGRLGGDEFLVILRAVHGRADVEERVTKLLAQVCQPTDLEGESVMVRTSLGAAVFPADGTSASTLLAAADAALYANKRERAAHRADEAAGESKDRRRNRTS